VLRRVIIGFFPLLLLFTAISAPVAGICICSLSLFWFSHQAAAFR
jgi:hypothetical protein